MTKVEFMKFMDWAKEQTASVNNFSTATDVFNALKEAEYRGYMKAVAERPQGEWIYTNNPLRLDDEWECSRCGNISFVKTNFCDRCGSKMKG